MHVIFSIVFSSPRRMSGSQFPRKRDAVMCQFGEFSKHDEHKFLHVSFPFELDTTPLCWLQNDKIKIGDITL